MDESRDKWGRDKSGPYTEEGAKPDLHRLQGNQDTSMIISDSRTTSDTAGARTVEDIRKDFPILSRQVHEKPLVFLDSGASSQKPAAVIEAMDHYYRTYHANVHRGVYEISEEATAAMEKAR